jgi:hypothetical protein
MKDGTSRVTLPRVTGEKGILRLADVLGVHPSHLIETADEAATSTDLVNRVGVLDERITTLDVKIDDLRSALARVEALVRSLTTS